jgi:hypothetical protein
MDFIDSAISYLNVFMKFSILKIFENIVTYELSLRFG